RDSIPLAQERSRRTTARLFAPWRESAGRFSFPRSSCNGAPIRPRRENANLTVRGRTGGSFSRKIQHVLKSDGKRPNEHRSDCYSPITRLSVKASLSRSFDRAANLPRLDRF